MTQRPRLSIVVFLSLTIVILRFDEKTNLTESKVLLELFNEHITPIYMFGIIIMLNGRPQKRCLWIRHKVPPYVLRWCWIWMRSAQEEYDGNEPFERIAVDTAISDTNHECYLWGATQI